MQPASLLASVSATQAQTCSFGSSPKRAALVPCGEGLGVRFLDEEGAGPYQDVGTDHILDRIEDARVAGEIVEPREWA
jgi:hypothetical protein